jgi:hypothetical protein
MGTVGGPSGESASSDGPFRLATRVARAHRTQRHDSQPVSCGFIARRSPAVTPAGSDQAPYERHEVVIGRSYGESALHGVLSRTRCAAHGQAGTVSAPAWLLRALSLCTPMPCGNKAI